jgi:hypothetical protein
MSVTLHSSFDKVLNIKLNFKCLYKLVSNETLSYETSPNLKLQLISSAKTEKENNKTKSMSRIFIIIKQLKTELNSIATILKIFLKK